MAAKAKIDWSLIEPDWRAGTKSGQQLAEEYSLATGVSVTRAAISKHFKARGIERDAPVLRVGRVVLNAEERDEFSASGFIYVIYLDAPERFYKIGMAKHFGARFDAHQCASPFDLCVACAFFTSNMRQAEQALHSMFSGQRVRGEWFRLSDSDLLEIAAKAVLG